MTERQLTDNITWREFKESVESQGVTDDTRIDYIRFRAWLRIGDKNIKPKVKEDKIAETVSIME